MMTHRAEVWKHGAMITVIECTNLSKFLRALRRELQCLIVEGMSDYTVEIKHVDNRDPQIWKDFL